MRGGDKSETSIHLPRATATKHTHKTKEDKAQQQEQQKQPQQQRKPDQLMDSKRRASPKANRHGCGTAPPTTRGRALCAYQRERPARSGCGAHQLTRRQQQQAGSLLLLALLAVQLALVELELAALQDVAVSAAALARARRDACQQAAHVELLQRSGSESERERERGTHTQTDKAETGGTVMVSEGRRDWGGGGPKQNMGRQAGVTYVDNLGVNDAVLGAAGDLALDVVGARGGLLLSALLAEVHTVVGLVPHAEWGGVDLCVVGRVTHSKVCTQCGNV